MKNDSEVVKRLMDAEKEIEELRSLTMEMKDRSYRLESESIDPLCPSSLLFYSLIYDCFFQTELCSKNSLRQPIQLVVSLRKK